MQGRQPVAAVAARAQQAGRGRSSFTRHSSTLGDRVGGGQCTASSVPAHIHGNHPAPCPMAAGGRGAAHRKRSGRPGDISTATPQAEEQYTGLNQEAWTVFSATMGATQDGIPVTTPHGVLQAARVPDGAGDQRGLSTVRITQVAQMFRARPKKHNLPDTDLPLQLQGENVAQAPP